MPEDISAADQTVEPCEKSEDQGEITLGITLALLLSLYSNIDNVIKELYKYLDNTNKKKGMEMHAELFLKQLRGLEKKSPPKMPKKRGRKPKFTPEQLEEMNQRRELLFVKFWTKYPRKEGQSGAHRWWLRIPDLELIFPKIMEALDWQIKAWEGGRYAPAPAKYILDKRWNDEPKMKATKTNSAFKDLEYDFPQN